jgi:hypothetical protein
MLRELISAEQPKDTTLHAVKRAIDSGSLSDCKKSIRKLMDERPKNEFFDESSYALVMDLVVYTLHKVHDENKCRAIVSLLLEKEIIWSDPFNTARVIFYAALRNDMFLVKAVVNKTGFNQSPSDSVTEELLKLLIDSSLREIQDYNDDNHLMQYFPMDDSSVLTYLLHQMAVQRFLISERASNLFKNYYTELLSSTFDVIEPDGVETFEDLKPGDYSKLDEIRCGVFQYLFASLGLRPLDFVAPKLLERKLSSRVTFADVVNARKLMLDKQSELKSILKRSIKTEAQVETKNIVENEYFASIMHQVHQIIKLTSQTENFFKQLSSPTKSTLLRVASDIVIHNLKRTEELSGDIFDFIAILYSFDPKDVLSGLILSEGFAVEFYDEGVLCRAQPVPDELNIFTHWLSRAAITCLTHPSMKDILNVWPESVLGSLESIILGVFFSQEGASILKDKSIIEICATKQGKKSTLYNGVKRLKPPNEALAPISPSPIESKEEKDRTLPPKSELMPDLDPFESTSLSYFMSPDGEESGLILSGDREVSISSVPSDSYQPSTNAMPDENDGSNSVFYSNNTVVVGELYEPDARKEEAGVERRAGMASTELDIGTQGGSEFISGKRAPMVNKKDENPEAPKRKKAFSP